VRDKDAPGIGTGLPGGAHREATGTGERGVGVWMEDGPPRVMRAHRTLSPRLCITARIEQTAGASGRWLTSGRPGASYAVLNGASMARNEQIVLESYQNCIGVFGGGFTWLLPATRRN